MEQYEKDRIVRMIRNEETAPDIEFIIRTIERLWMDYIGAYNEGRADGLQKMAEILTGGEE